MFWKRNPSKELRGRASPPRPPSGAFAPWTPFPPFDKVEFGTIKVCTPHVHVCSTIKRNLTSAPRQKNSSFLFPISDKVSYAPRQSNCSYLTAYVHNIPLMFTISDFLPVNKPFFTAWKSLERHVEFFLIETNKDCELFISNKYIFINWLYGRISMPSTWKKDFFKNDRLPSNYMLIYQKWSHFRNDI